VTTAKEAQAEWLAHLAYERRASPLAGQNPSGQRFACQSRFPETQ